jgi:hypothetical protein
MGKFVDLTGQKFGNWVVKSFIETREVGKSKVKKAFWLCECQCEKKTIREIPTDSLKSGNSISCGCYKNKILVERSTKHGFARRGKNCSSIYHVWYEMKDRCNNQNNKQFCNYGGRGISICKEWNDSFLVFKDWAYANGYSETLTIDRIDVNGDYCPENCTWIDMKEQQYNKTCTVLVNGRSLAKMARENGIEPKLACYRYKAGWDLRDILHTKPGEKRK